MLKIAIDIDGTIDISPVSIEFFKKLTKSLDAKIFILTNRNPSNYSRQCTSRELDGMGIKYDHLIITADKVKCILDNDINIFFENTDEYFLDLPESVIVFKARESMNFDFSSKRWYFSNKTGINIDKEY